MNVLLDANVLIRLADPTSKAHTIAATAVSTLRAQGDSLYIVPQSIYEFWAVATRPIANNVSPQLNLLVIKGGRFNRRRLTTKIYSHLHGADAAVDVIVVTPEEVERYRDTHCLVICPALREGKVVYGA